MPMRVGSRVKIYFDGGCRPNPGMMEIAVVARGVVHIDRQVGAGTGMDAEWLALIAALRLAIALNIPDYVLLGDAAAVINQATGRARIRTGFADHFSAFHALAAGGAPRIRYIKRNQNLAGIALSRWHQRRQLDSTTKISPS